MNLIEECTTILRTAGFFVGKRGDVRLLFEDEVVFGAVFEYPSIIDLLRGWEARQDAFLAENAARIRRSASKSWNIYTVHLTPGPAEPENKLALARVEEDFRGTRKIAKAEFTTREAVVHALSPLLPLIKGASMEQPPLSARLDKALNLPAPLKRLILGGGKIDEIANALLNLEDGA